MHQGLLPVAGEAERCPHLSTCLQLLVPGYLLLLRRRGGGRGAAGGEDEDGDRAGLEAAGDGVGLEGLRPGEVDEVVVVPRCGEARVRGDGGRRCGDGAVERG